jgi:hypothetical protein
MVTVSEPRPRVKAELQASLCEHAGLVVLVLTVLSKYRPRTDLYFLTQIACDDLAFRLRKVDATRDGTDREESEYCVNLSDDSCGCSCKGWQRWGSCKHRESLITLHAEGVLP